MGFIRSGIVFILSIIFFISIFTTNLFLTFDKSLTFNNTAHYLENLGLDPNETYYQNYSCTFQDCLKEYPKEKVYLSKLAKDNAHNYFNLFLIISILLALLMIIISDSRSFTISAIGVLIGVASLIFLKVDWFVGMIPKFLIGDYAQAFTKNALEVFYLVGSIGLIIFAVGLLFAFFELTQKIINAFKWIFRMKKDDEKIDKKEVDKIVKEEVEKVRLRDKIRSKFKKKKS